MSALATPRLVMFDLDGTMVDTAPDLAYAVNESLRQLGLQSSGEEEIRKWVGNGAETLMRMALTGSRDTDPDPDLLQRSLEIFESVYANNLTRGSKLFSGTLSCLQELRQRGIDIVCVTNKKALYTEPLLQQLGIDQMFSLIISGDSLPRCKPHPDQLLHAMQQRGVDPGQSWMVGDSANDVNSAQAAGAAALCVDYGYTAVPAADLGADVLLSDLHEIIGLL